MQRRPYTLCESPPPVRIVALAALVLLSLAGCSDEPDRDLTPVYPVHGTLTYQGQPMAGARITLADPMDLRPTALRSHGVTDDAGTFQLTSYMLNDGAPQGEFVVTIYWPDKRKLKPDVLEEEQDLPDLLGGRYTNPRISKLRATVSPTQDNEISFALP